MLWQRTPAGPAVTLHSAHALPHIHLSERAVRAHINDALHADAQLEDSKQRRVALVGRAAVHSTNGQTHWHLDRVCQADDASDEEICVQVRDVH